MLFDHPVSRPDPSATVDLVAHFFGGLAQVCDHGDRRLARVLWHPRHDQGDRVFGHAGESLGLLCAGSGQLDQPAASVVGILVPLDESA